MKSPTPASKTHQASSTPLRQRLAAGAHAVARAAPAYGIAFADQRSPVDAPLQRKQGPGAASQPASPKRTGLPDRLKAGIESLSGLSMDGVAVHYNSPRPAQLNALAYAQGRDIHLAPGQEHHLPHEAWHVVQQAQGRVAPTRQLKGGPAVNDAQGLEQEADLMGARAWSVSVAAPAGGAALVAPGPASTVVQRYTEEIPPEVVDAGNTWRVSDDEQAMLEISQNEGGQWLLATDTLVDAANTKLKAVGQNGSFIRLKAGKKTTSLGGRSLKQVLPTFVDASGAETFNTDMATANKPGGADATGDTQNWFKMYADCGRSSRVVMGSLGLAPKALYSAGKKGKQTARAFNPEEWTDQVYLQSMKAFVKDPANRVHLKTTHLKERFLSYFYTGADKFVPKEPANGQEAKNFAGALDDAGQQAFAEYAKINVAVNPEIGEGYTMATGYDLPGFSGGANAWNFHWAGVVMKAGADNITLENYAIMFKPTGDPVKDAKNQQRAYDFTNTNWVFQMYGTVKTGQSFHEEHLRSGTHGTQGTTLRVKI